MFKKITLLLTALMLASCSSDPLIMSETTKVTVRFYANPDVNLDQNSRPSPFVVRVYELTSANSFESADFFSLYDDGKSTLGASLISLEEINMKPGDKFEAKYALNKKTQFIGIIAAYRDIDNTQWRLVAPVEVQGKMALNVGFNANGIFIPRKL